MKKIKSRTNLEYRVRMMPTRGKSQLLRVTFAEFPKFDDSIKFHKYISIKRFMSDFLNSVIERRSRSKISSRKLSSTKDVSLDFERFKQVGWQCKCAVTISKLQRCVKYMATGLVAKGARAALSSSLFRVFLPYSVSIRVLHPHVPLT